MRKLSLLLIAATASYQACQPLRRPGALTDLVETVEPHELAVQRVRYLGRDALRVEFAPELQARVLQTGLTNVPALALVPLDFTNGVIEVDVAGEVNGRGGPESRAFVGVAFHIAEDMGTYEMVYLRMTNGRLAQPIPPEPRVSRAIQYIAHPDFHFDVSRVQAPGRFERGANIAPAMWIRFRLEISGTQLNAFVNDEAEPSLTIRDLRRPNERGRLAFWVGDGTTGYFSNLRVRPASAP